MHCERLCDRQHNDDVRHVVDKAGNDDGHDEDQHKADEDVASGNARKRMSEIGEQSRFSDRTDNDKYAD